MLSSHEDDKWKEFVKEKQLDFTGSHQKLHQ